VSASCLNITTAPTRSRGFGPSWQPNYTSVQRCMCASFFLARWKHTRHSCASRSPWPVDAHALATEACAARRGVCLDQQASSCDRIQEWGQLEMQSQMGGLVGSSPCVCCKCDGEDHRGHRRDRGVPCYYSENGNGARGDVRSGHERGRRGGGVRQRLSFCVLTHKVRLTCPMRHVPTRRREGFTG
jgi:hypothetical protein